MIKSLLVSIMLCLVLIACESPTEPKTTVINEITSTKPIYCKWVKLNGDNYTGYQLESETQNLIKVDTIKVYAKENVYFVEVYYKGYWECLTVSKIKYVLM